MNRMIRMIRMIRITALLALLSGGAGLAQAQQSTFKLGVTRYQTHAETTGITGVPSGSIPPGADAQIGSATTALATYEYEVMPNVGVELVLGIPPKIKAKGSGSVAFLGQVLEAKNLAPTLLVNYHFGNDGDRLRPYVGAGINFTRFIGISSPYGWQVSLTDSWGPTVQAGLNYTFDKQWGAFASIAAVKTKSDLLAVGATVLQTSIDFRPVVYTAGLSYRF